MKHKTKGSSLFASVFGTWNSPPWASNLHQKSKNSPKTFWGSILCLIALIGFGCYAIHWYQHLPKPTYVKASITPPDITANEETLVPQNLIINFGIQNNEFITQSVAPISLIGKVITEGIEMTPKMPGQWIWNNDHELLFTPSEDWPAGQKYSIHFSKNFFAANTQMERYDASFSTKPFAATFSEFKFYQDPVNSDIHQAVASINFNFPVDAESLEKNTKLMFQTMDKGQLNSSGETIGFTYTFDEHKRVAYLHSDTIKIKEVPQYLLLTLNKDLTSKNGATLQENLSKNLLIPDTSNFLKVLSASAAIVRNDKDRPEQILTVETTLGINESDFNKAVHVYLLPKDYPATAVEQAKPNYQWQIPGEVTANILALATPLAKTAIPNEHNYSTLHSFKFSAQTPQYIYIKIDKGMKGFGNFSLNTDFAAIIPVPEYPKEISFLHKGSLLALSSEKKLSVLVRGVPAVKFDFARILPENINQLVTQTQGDFNNPYFINPSFNQQNISQISTDIQQFDSIDLTKQQYTALDLGKYLTSNPSSSVGPQGLFLVQATGWDVTNKVALDVKASRLILITDMGLIVKDNNDGSHDVFVNSITQGIPLSGVTLMVLGKNGLPILSRTTDAQGQANFPSLKDFVEDREPTVYIAQLNNDVAFIPFSNYNRQLNFSKFDVGGIYTNNQDPHNLSAYLFSDRGIYRPGDTVHIGMIVKQSYAKAQPAGLPLQLTILDARGTTIKDQKISLNDTGYMDVDFSTTATSPTGQYQVNLYLVKDNLPQNILGSTTIQVNEFQPDRMRISSNLLPKPSDGWSSPVDLKASVGLWNLYGAPAMNRKVSAKILLTPQKIEFEEFPDYIFSDPLFDPKKPPKIFTETLTDSTTNDKGEVEFDLNLERFEKATYQLTFFAEGFEAEGGRSVTTQSKTLVSPLPYFVGYKADGDLSFIKQNSTRTVNYVAINPQLSKEEIKGLKIQLTSLRPVTTLVKKPDGTYQYQSIIQSAIVSTNPFDIETQGSNYNIPSQDIGDYLLSVLDKNNTVLSQLKFSIVGASQQPLAKNAELSIKLDKEEYQPNDEIQIQITAPYTGSGLITIERDKVYATQWFKTTTTSSLQSIHIPADFQGDGYINVTFIRDWESPELFISPLSYSVAPFTMNHDNQDIKINLNSPKVVRPGENLSIDYHTDKASKIILFAVDQGILQVARYDTPDPLGFFFQKHALEVLTQQIVDQILPKFIQSRELSAMGGDNSAAELAGRLNPFKRKTDLPVVFWSGILDADATNRQVTYQVPDYFNGSIKIMAVAVSTDSVGSEDTSTAVRGDFIISPNVPAFVAPGDEFEISSSIANNIKDSGHDTEVVVDLATSPEMEVIGSAQQTLTISEGHEQTVHFKLRAKSNLGSAKVSFTASSGAKRGKMDATLSIRPASPFSTYIHSGQTKDTKKTIDLLHNFYPELHKVEATISSSPFILIFGLQQYLDHFPYGCTEQLTSKALPLIAMNGQSQFAKDSSQINKQVNTTIQMLSQRQMSNGSFSYWPGFGENAANTFTSVYAMHFLTEARAQGFNVPNELVANGLNYLKQLASETASDSDKARIQAYAIYILTRNEQITTNYLTNLQLFLEKDSKQSWQKEITGAYIAASYQLMKSDEDANRLIGLYQAKNPKAYASDFFDANSSDAQYLYLIAKHFPNLVPQLGEPLVEQLVKAINNTEINTVLSGFASLALSAYPAPVEAGTLSISELSNNNKETTFSLDNENYKKLDIDTDVKQVSFNNPNKQSFFYQLMQSGFNNDLAQAPIKQGLEIFREYRNEKGEVIQSTPLGSEIEVHIQIRALDNNYLTNIAIEDLLPGGFEVVRDSVKTDRMDYVDIREDRVNFFGGIDSNATQLVYKIKATNPGTYLVPPVYAESMYNPGLKAQGAASKISITGEKF